MIGLREQHPDLVIGGKTTLCPNTGEMWHNYPLAHFALWNVKMRVLSFNETEIGGDD